MTGATDFYAKTTELEEVQLQMSRLKKELDESFKKAKDKEEYTYQKLKKVKNLCE